jgi:hypothetical protein
VNQDSFNFVATVYAVAHHFVMLESIELCAQLVVLWMLIVSHARR